VLELPHGMGSARSEDDVSDPEPTAERVSLSLDFQFTRYELVVIAEIRRRGGFATIEHCVLSGLYLLSRQLDIDPPIDTFAIRSG